MLIKTQGYINDVDFLANTKKNRLLSPIVWKQHLSLVSKVHKVSERIIRNDIGDII